MTWAEFKKLVEDKGVKDDDLMSYIDVHDDPEGMRVEFEPNYQDEKRRYFHIWS